MYISCILPVCKCVMIIGMKRLPLSLLVPGTARSVDHAGAGPVKTSLISMYLRSLIEKWLDLLIYGISGFDRYLSKVFTIRVSNPSSLLEMRNRANSSPISISFAWLTLIYDNQMRLPGIPRTFFERNPTPKCSPT